MVIKPSNPQVNLGNPLLTGLVLDTALSEGAGLKAFDKVNRVEGALSGTPTWRNGLYGKELLFSPASNNIVSYTTTSPQNNLSYVSVEALVYLNGAGEGSAGRIFSKGSTTRISLSYGTATFGRDNCLVAFSTFSGTSGTWLTEPDSFTVGNYYHIVYVHDVATAGSVPTIYINGVFQPILSGTTSAGTLQADTANLYIGSQASQVRDFDGKIVYNRMWNRLLTPTEAKQLYVNPYSIYQRPKSLNILGQAAVSAGSSSMFGDEGLFS